MNSIISLFKSSLGKKFIMAGTGLVLFLFVIGHLLGNLQIYGPPEMINQYGHFLKSTPEVLWTARIVLLVCVTLHILTAVQLTAMNRAARPVAYASKDSYGSSFYSRYMMVSGLVVLAFVLYHLAHFTVLLPGVNGVGDFTRLETTLPGGIQTHDVYAMMVLGFQVWWVVLFYVIAQVLLFAHLSHGVVGMFQSLGLRNHVWAPRIQMFAKLVCIAIAIGYLSIPLAIYFRVVGEKYADEKRTELQAAALMEQSGKETK